jgi:hypothetical protein
MADIPEHQLSTERLRHAILNQGLKPKPARRQIGWLWMPATAMVLAFSIAIIRNMNSSALPQVGGPVADNRLSTDGSNLPDSVVAEPRLENAFAFATASGEIISVEKKAASAAKPSVHRRTHREAASDEGAQLEELKDAIKKEFENMASTPPVAVKALAASEPKPAAKRSAVVAEEAPIVIIDSTKDKTTGAQRATEVDSASNVLVGG